MPLPRRVRSVLFAPAVRPDLVAKMPSTGADAIVIDLEDATPINAKDSARADLGALVDEVRGKVAVMVRVNDASTEWFAADIAALPAGLAGVVVPKVETGTGLDDVGKALVGADRGCLSVVAGLETARGVADAPLLLSHPIVAAAYFGAEDFIADLGGIRTESNMEVASARAAVALAGRLAGAPVIDQIVADFRDDDRCRRESGEARAMGFAGKLCIHPAQVAIANEAWTPAEVEVAAARRLLAAYDAATAKGVAAIDFEGRMVDEPVARQARRILMLAAHED